MKKVFMLLALASLGHATINDSTPVQVLDAGIRSPSLIPVGTPVYALNQALTGVASAAIDLSGTSGVWVTVTGTSMVRVGVYFSNSNVSPTTGAVSMYAMNAPGSYPIEPKARYLSFANSGSCASCRVSVNYMPVLTSAGTVVFSGSINAFITGTVKVDAQGSSVVAYQGTNPWVTTGNVSITSGTVNAFVTGTVQTTGNVSITSGTMDVNLLTGGISVTAGTNPWPITGTVNASGFNFLSFTVLTGLTTNAATTQALTTLFGVSSGAGFVDINCSGATGINYIITNSGSVPSGYVANAALSGYQPCGQISQIPLECNLADTPNIHAVAVGLSATSASLGITSKQRP